MPNGGSDCCGTCWHNRVNEGKSGYDRPGAAKGITDYCEIRGVDITDPFYTYCMNHPYHLPEGGRIPVGPIFTGDSNGSREYWMPSPDTEEVRANLLRMLDDREGVAERDKYPFFMSIASVALLQLAEFREQRAVPVLERLLEKEPESSLFKNALEQLQNT